MNHWRSIFCTFIVLTGIVRAEVSPLRPNEQADAPRGMAPLLDQWIRQSPLPTGSNLNGIAWATATHAFAVGTGLTLLETFDAGATWRKIDLPWFETDPFYNIECIDANTCVAIGNSATDGANHFRTTDAGATWQRITQFPVGGSWAQIDFVSPTVGFMGANGGLARTTNGGASWQPQSGYPSCPVIYGMDFRDTLVGLAGGDRVAGSDSGPGIFKTSDAGVTWVRKYSQSANDVLWLNDTTALATVGVSILRSTNSGDTWSPISSQLSTGLDEMTLLPNGTIVGVSPAGDAWRSTDGGVNWTRTLVGPGALPASWNLSFFDDQLGMVVGQGGYMFRTTDGGLTWTPLNSGIGGVEFLDIEMFDENTGLAVGQSGYYLRTTNGGNFWSVGRLQVSGLTLFRDENLYALNIVDHDFVVAAGNNGVVYKSFDRGVNWQSIGFPLLPDDFLINDVKFIDHNVGYVTGTRPFFAILTYRTTDGGASWTALDNLPAHFVDFVDPNNGWVITIGGTGHRTTNGGATWQPITLPPNYFGGNPIVSEVDFISANVGWAVGWYGYAVRTSNGGQTWQKQNIATQDDVILGLHVLSETEAYAVGIRQTTPTENASVYHTTNAGTTWTKSSVTGVDFLNTIFAVASGNVWTAGYGGAVLHQGGTSGTLQVVSAVSRLNHGAAGAFDVDLPLAGAGVECRDGNGNFSLVFTFSSNVVSGTASVTSGSGTAGTPTFSGATMTVPLSGVTDVQTITVTLTGVTDATNQVLPNTSVSAKMLIGDVTGDKTVDRSDLSLTKGQVRLPVTASNFREDVKVSGTITSADVKTVQSAKGHTLP